MPDSDDSDDLAAGGQVDEPTVAPTTGELLLARIDEHCRLLGLELDPVAKACEQLHPERSRSCRNALTMCSVMSTRSACGPTPDRSTRPATCRTPNLYLTWYTCRPWLRPGAVPRMRSVRSPYRGGNGKGEGGMGVGERPTTSDVRGHWRIHRRTPHRGRPRLVGTRKSHSRLGYSRRVGGSAWNRRSACCRPATIRT
jgi:hypothetical protein